MGHVENLVLFESNSRLARRALGISISHRREKPDFNVKLIKIVRSLRNILCAYLATGSQVNFMSEIYRKIRQFVRVKWWKEICSTQTSERHAHYFAVQRQFPFLTSGIVRYPGEYGILGPDDWFRKRQQLLGDRFLRGELKWDPVAEEGSVPRGTRWPWYTSSAARALHLSDVPSKTFLRCDGSVRGLCYPAARVDGEKWREISLHERASVTRLTLPREALQKIRMLILRRCLCNIAECEIYFGTVPCEKSSNRIPAKYTHFSEVTDSPITLAESLTRSVINCKYDGEHLALWGSRNCWDGKKYYSPRCGTLELCGGAHTHYEPRYAYRLRNTAWAGSLYFTGTKSFVSERRVVRVC